MMILAVDLGRFSGWAAGVAGGPPKHGTLRLPQLYSRQDIGPAAAAFSNGFADLIREHDPRQIAIEAPLPVAITNKPGGVHNRELDVHFQLALIGLAHLLAFRRERPIIECHVQSVRAGFLRGIPKDTPAGDPLGAKERVNLACVKRGWSPADDHQADALALWAHACALAEARAA